MGFHVPPNVQLSSNRLIQKHLLHEQTQTLTSKLKFQVARGLGTCIPPFRRWADQQQAAYTASLPQDLNDQSSFPYPHHIKRSISDRKIQQIKYHAEFLELEKSVEASLESEDEALLKQKNYAKARSIIDAQVPVFVDEILNASKCFRIQPNLIQKAEAGDSDARHILAAISETVIRAEILKTGFGFPHQQLKFEARLILDRLNDSTSWLRNRFKRFNDVILRNHSSTKEVLGALRELSFAIELKAMISGKHVDVPKARLTYLIDQFRDLIFFHEMKGNSDFSPEKWMSAFTKHPVIIQCWQLGNSPVFLDEVKEQVKKQLGLLASEKAVTSAERDKILIESLLTAFAERAEPGIEQNAAYHWMNDTSMPINMANNSGNNAADFVRNDFWQALNEQVSKETNISFETLRSS